MGWIDSHAELRDIIVRSSKSLVTKCMFGLALKFRQKPNGVSVFGKVKITIQLFYRAHMLIHTDVFGV